MQLSPRQFHKITSSVAEASFQEGLDAGLLLSVILSESSFRTDAVSNKGAVGLMQLMPATAAGLAAELDLDWAAARGPELLEDPEVNIQLGAYYLRKLIEAYDDDVSMALTGARSIGEVNRRVLAHSVPRDRAGVRAQIQRVPP